MRRLLLCVLSAGAVVLPAVPVSATPDSDWSVSFGSSAFDGSVVVQAMPDGSVIAVTKHDFGGSGSTSVRRVDADGSTRWVTVIPAGAGGTYGAEFRSSALLPSGDVVVAGYSDSDRSLRGSLDATVLIVHGDGRWTHAESWGGPGSDFATEIGVCPDGSFYVGGGAWGSSVSPEETSSIGMVDIWVTRFAADASRGWSRQIGSSDNDALFALRCGQDGSVDLNAWAAGSVNGHGSDRHYNFFTTRFSAAGDVERTIVSELDAGEWSPQSGAYAPDGSYYVVGESNSEYRGMPCTERALGGSFVSKYSPDGILQWRSILPCGNLNRRIAVGRSGDLFVLGTSSNIRIAGQEKIGMDDVLLHRYAPDGTRLWTRQFGSDQDDVGSSISVDMSGHAFIGAYMKGDFGGHVAVGDWDAHVIRMDVADAPAAPSAVSSPQACDAESSVVLPEARVPRPVWFYGDDIGEAEMDVLWDYASTHGPRDFGRLIAADQDWFGSCSYPGIGLGTGSGYSWHDRNVVLWIWADDVDPAAARESVMKMIAASLPALPPTTVSPTVEPSPPTTIAAVPTIVSTAQADVVAGSTQSVTGAPVAAVPTGVAITGNAITGTAMSIRGNASIPVVVPPSRVQRVSAVRKTKTTPKRRSAPRHKVPKRPPAVLRATR